MAAATGVFIGSARAPADPSWSAAALAPGQPVNIVSRGQWGADESLRRGAPLYDSGIRAGIVHHSASGNDYSPQDSAAIVRSIYEYHLGLGWSDIGYNALVDKYGLRALDRFSEAARAALEYLGRTTARQSFRFSSPYAVPRPGEHEIA